MKSLILLFCISMHGLFYGQVGINTTVPTTTLQIDRKASSNTVEGLMIPRLTGDAIFNMPITGAALESNLVYATSPASLANQVGIGVNLKNKGFFYWDGNLWATLDNTTTTINNLLAFVKPMNILLNDVNTYPYSTNAFVVPNSPKLKLFDCSYLSPVDVIIENNPLSGPPNNFVIWDNANSKINIPQQLLGNIMSINISLKYQEITANAGASRFVAYTGNAVYNATAGTVTGGTKIKDLMFKQTKTSGFTTIRDELVLSPIIITQEMITNGIKLYLGSGDNGPISFYEPVLTIDFGVVNTTL